MSINDCTAILDSSEGFPSDWISSYSFNTELEIQNSSTGIFSRINSISNLLYDKLNLSILTGEYLEIEKVKTELDLLSQKISAIPLTIELDQTKIDLQNQIASNLLFHLVNPLKNSIKDYKIFINALNRNLKYSEQSVLFESLSNSQIFSFNINEHLFDSSKLSKVFAYNLRIAKIDHNLCVKKEILNELLLLKNEFEKTISNSLKVIDKILIDKCNYLIKKILYRFQEDSKNYLYAFDFEDKEIHPEDIKIEYYDEFDIITQGHYEKTTNHAQTRRKWLEQVYNKIENNETLCFKDYHIAIKEYKDETKNLHQLENLNKKFKELYKLKIENKNNTTFNRRSLQVTYNYMLNNEFSFMLNSNEVTYDNILEKYKEICNLQSTSRIKNYFPTIRFASYLTLKIDLLFKEAPVKSNIIRPFIEKLERVLKDAYVNYEWCKDKNFLSFQLPFDECTLKKNIDTVDYNFFLSSSFVLPLNYEKIKEELKELSRRLEKFKTLLEVHDNLQSEKNSIIELRENIKKNDRRSIEILGIFSAIVLFTSSSVQIFSIDGITFKDGLKFMLCYSFSLTLFIFLIWLITRENITSVTKIHKIFFFSLAFIALVSLLFTCNWWPFR